MSVEWGGGVSAFLCSCDGVGKQGCDSKEVFKKIEEITGAFTKVNEKANFRSVLYLGPGTSLWGFYS